MSAWDRQGLDAPMVASMPARPPAPVPVETCRQPIDRSFTRARTGALKYQVNQLFAEAHATLYLAHWARERHGCHVVAQAVAPPAA